MNRLKQKKWFCFFLFFVSQTNFCFGQKSLSDMEVIPNIGITVYFKINNVYYLQYYDKSAKNIKIIVNNKIIDNEMYFRESAFIHDDNILYGNSGENFYFDLKKESFFKSKHLGSQSFQGVINNNILGLRQVPDKDLYENMLFFYNPYTQRKDSLWLQKRLNLSSDEGILSIKILDEKQILFETGFFDYGADNLRYWKYSVQEGNISNITNNFKIMNSLQLLLTLDKSIIVDKKNYKILIESDKVVDYRQEFQNSFIYDNNLNNISYAVRRNFRKVGENIQGGFRTSYITSVLDDKSRVIVEVDFNLILEEQIYKVFSDQDLLLEDINKLSKLELRLLRNFIFAKHNRAFRNKYLQAYFNTFYFYKTQLDSRKEDIGDSLTDKDKKNIKLILDFE